MACWAGGETWPGWAPPCPGDTQVAGHSHCWTPWSWQLWGGPLALSLTRRLLGLPSPPQLRPQFPLWRTGTKNSSSSTSDCGCVCSAFLPVRTSRIQASCLSLPTRLLGSGSRLGGAGAGPSPHPTPASSMVCSGSPGPGRRQDPLSLPREFEGPPGTVYA